MRPTSPGRRDPQLEKPLRRPGDTFGPSAGRPANPQRAVEDRRGLLEVARLALGEGAEGLFGLLGYRLYRDASPCEYQLGFHLPPPLGEWAGALVANPPRLKGPLGR